MLNFFRSGGVGQFLVAAIAFAIILVFALEFRTGAQAPSAKLAQECAVKYAGYCVDSKEYYAAYGMIAPRNIEPKQAKRLELRRRALDGLVERELLAAEAQRIGLEISEEMLDEDLADGRIRASLPAQDLPQLAVTLGMCPSEPSGFGCTPGSEYPIRQIQVKRSPDEPFDYKRYERQVRLLTNRGPREFKEMQEREMLAARMRDIVRSRVRIPESEAWMLFERARTRAVVRSVQLDRDWFAKYAVKLDDGAVKRWALGNTQQVDADWESKKSDFSPGCTLASEILIEIPTVATDDEKSALRQKAEAARERVVKGEPLPKVAREVSEGPSAVLGGELGCLGKNYGIGSDELLKAAESLAPGQVSAVLESPRGFHVLHVDGKLAADKVEETGRGHVARRLYARFAADEALSRFAEQLIARTKAGEKLEEVTRDLIASMGGSESANGAVKSNSEQAAPPALLAADRPKFEVSAPFNAAGNPFPELQPLEPIAARAFELKQADAVYEKPIATASGAIVLQLKERTDPTREEFIKEKPELLRMLLQDKSWEALARHLQELRRAAGDKLQIQAEFGEEPKNTSGDE
jgi:peptidyl-prolyl cis-trans isomerase D